MNDRESRASSQNRQSSKEASRLTIGVFTVPAGSKSIECRGPKCTGRFYWIHANGRPLPIDCDGAGGIHPSAHRDVAQLDAFGTAEAPHDGRGVLHHTRCVDVAFFKADRRGYDHGG